MKVKLIIYFLLITLISPITFAKEPVITGQITKETCFEGWQVASQTIAKRQVELMLQLKPILQDLIKVSSRVEDRNKPLLSQLKQADRDELNRLILQGKYLRTLFFIEAKRQANLETAEYITKSSDRLYNLEVKYISRHQSLDGFELYLNQLEIPIHEKAGIIAAWNMKVESTNVNRNE